MLVASFAPGCAKMKDAIKDDRRSLQYDDTIKAYLSAIRWGYFDIAEGFIRPRDDVAPPALDYEFLERIRISRYDLRNQRPTGPNEVHVVVTWSFYHTDYGTVKTFTDRQLWWYQEDEKNWYLDGSLPDFKGSLARAGN